MTQPTSEHPQDVPKRKGILWYASATVLGIIVVFLILTGVTALTSM